MDGEHRGNAMINRWALRKAFRTVGPAVTPVIHVRDEAQTLANAARAIRAGAAGVFLINHDFGAERLVPVIEAVRRAWPALWLGVNFLARPGREAFPVLGRLAAGGCQVDAYWADDACIDERTDDQALARETAAVRAASGWQGLYLGGVAFKKQRPVAPEDHARAARATRGWVDVVTTSGEATGVAAGPSKIAVFREALGDRPLALASGITPGNVDSYAAAVDLMLVATGINHPGDFHEIDPERLEALLARTRAIGAETRATVSEETAQ